MGPEYAASIDRALSKLPAPTFLPDAAQTVHSSRRFSSARVMRCGRVSSSSSASKPPAHDSPSVAADCILILGQN